MTRDAVYFFPFRFPSFWARLAFPLAVIALGGPFLLPGA
jgi:hypothetical protein